MTRVVHFENISKQYNLGLTRTSLPTIASQGIKALVTRKTHYTQNRVLWALKDVNFELNHSQSLALVGSNGAGKTTILKLLANITKPSSGRVTVNGKLSALIELGAGFHPDLTGRENIFLNGTILGLSRKEIERRFDDIVDFSELERFIDTPIKRYSSGMVVRLGFAVASCIEPDILLVDEVLAVGDASFQQKCLARIHSLIKSGTSLIFVSHNLYLVQAACNLALYMKEGQVNHYGAVKEVLDLYERDIHQERIQKFERRNSYRDGEKDDVEITHIQIRSLDEADAPVLCSNRPAQIRIYYNAYGSIGKVHLSAFIYRSDGVISCMMRTKLDGFDLFVERGQGVIELVLNPLQLVGGSYYIEASFLNESDSLILTSRVSRSDWFTVQGSARSYNEKSVFEPHTTWKHVLDDQLLDLDDLDQKSNSIADFREA
jgi:lipopolysaccharide transport system ATP-binding protein